MNKVGITFEELDDETLMTIQGGATPTTSATLTTASSVMCLGASFVVSATASILAITASKLFK